MAKAKFAIVVIFFTLGGTNAGELVIRPDQKPLLPHPFWSFPGSRIRLGVSRFDRDDPGANAPGVYLLLLCL